jgi:hypothetical protein
MKTSKKMDYIPATIGVRRVVLEMIMAMSCSPAVSPRIEYNDYVLESEDSGDVLMF